METGSIPVSAFNNLSGSKEKMPEICLNWKKYIILQPQIISRSGAVGSSPGS